MESIRKLHLVSMLSVALMLSACLSEAEPNARVAATGGGVSLVRDFPALSFDRPVDLQFAPGDDTRLFVVEQRGRIYVFDRRSPDTYSLFLDITDRVNSRGNEQGLLGLAFHPDFANNRAFYLDYTASNPNRTVIARFTVSPSAGGGAGESPVADVKSESVILEFPQPFSNHNGGQIRFGPDGYLYIAAGDGGSGGDPLGNGQNPGTLLAAILRIDPRADSYAIPPDNPFAGNSMGYGEEVFAYGLRNPWRFSFDPATDALWAADVGQDAYEEIDIIVPGGNYGWNIMEGEHCYSPPSGCNTTGLIPPVAEYDHSVGESVTGGFVYRGTEVSPLSGRYVYGDYVSGRIWTLPAGSPGSGPVLLFDTTLKISSFGVDQDGELYLLAFDGGIYRFQKNG